MSATRQPVVVLRSNDVCFLGIVRSLAAAGIETIAVTFTWPGAGPWYSERSRHLGEVHVIPNPFAEPIAARDAMVVVGRELATRFGERLVILGSSDTNLMFLFDNQDHLLPYFRLMGDLDLDRGQPDILHKARCAERLARAGVSIPLTRGCARAEDIDSVCDEMIFPCVYKPAVKDYGQTFYARHDGNKAIAIDTVDALRSALAGEIEAGFDLVVQERVDFASVSDEIPFYLYADASGALRMAATAIKEVIQPYPFGTATVLRLSHHPELIAEATEVVRALGYRGILMIELIRDRKDNQWKVIELNPRPWLFIDFFRRSGLNYLRCLVDDRDAQMAPSTPLITPPPTTKASEPVHIALATAAEPHLAALGRAPIPADVSSWLSSIEGERSLTTLDPDDLAPGLAEIEMMADRWGLDRGALLEVVRAGVSLA